ncbi:leucine-rich repeat domain-containing protein [Leptospira interrogans serovar Szwajizak]|uniref:leucine-rich repeat domain-containing protein n=1 Tax=Leptospira interrogans TaxID=173 RepID=UPI0003471AC6|nr:leucine-rich repeat domain-containing protein [Leptospira interrogans]
MKFRLTLICLQKITVCFQILICFFSQLQAEERNYKDLAKALQNPSKVFILNLSFNRITIFPKEIGQLQNLKSLDLSGNQLTTLPAEIGQLKNLKELHLNGNQLKTLPKEIGQLQKLEKLNLDGDQLITFSKGNQLTTLPAEIGQLKNLKELHLNGNQLSLEEREKIQKLLPSKCKIIFEVN